MLTIILLTFLTSFYLLKTLFLLYLNWERNSFSINISKTLSQKLFKAYLNQDYSFHLQNNSSTLLKNIQGEVQLFTSFITATINVTVEGSFAFGIIMILILTEPKGALIVMFFLGISAYIFSTFTKKKLKNQKKKDLNLLKKVLLKRSKPLQVGSPKGVWFDSAENGAPSR